MKKLFEWIKAKLNIRFVVRSWFCKHDNKDVIFEDHVERCTHYWCSNCHKDIYIGWD